MKSKLLFFAALAGLCGFYNPTLPALTIIERAEDRDDRSIQNLKQIGLAIAMFADDKRGRMPQMRTIEELQNALVGSYVANGSVFFHPTTREPYTPNPAMSGAMWQVPGEDHVLVYESSPAEDGTRAVLFNDGRVEQLSMGRWEELQQKFNLPVPLADRSLKNLHELGRAVLLYAQDGDKTLPPFQDMAAAKQAILPYAGMRDVFGHPETREPYQPNIALAGKKLGDIPNPKQAALFFEARSTNGRRAVLFADGHIEQVNDEMWSKLKAEQNLP